MRSCGWRDPRIDAQLLVSPCCSVLQCTAVCCSVLQCAVVCCSALWCVAMHCSVLQFVVGCSQISTELLISHSVAAHLQFVAVFCSVLQRVTFSCKCFLGSMRNFWSPYLLQCAAVCCRVPSDRCATCDIPKRAQYLPKRAL